MTSEEFALAVPSLLGRRNTDAILHLYARELTDDLQQVLDATRHYGGQPEVVAAGCGWLKRLGSHEYATVAADPAGPLRPESELGFLKHRCTRIVAAFALFRAVFAGTPVDFLVRD